MNTHTTQVDTTSFTERRIGAMRRKRTAVQRLLENSYKFDYNDVEKMLDLYFAQSFLPNWYFHSNSAEEIANHICITTQLLNARTDYLRHVSTDGKVITYFINIGRDFPGKMLSLVEENRDMDVISYDTVLTRSGIRIVTMERRGRTHLELSQGEREEIEEILDEVREHSRTEGYVHAESFIESLPPNYMNEEINALTYPRRILRHLEMYEDAMSTDGMVVKTQDTEWEMDDENEKLDQSERRLGIAFRGTGASFIPSILTILKQAEINMNRSYFDTFEHPESGETVGTLSIYLHTGIDLTPVVAEIAEIKPSSTALGATPEYPMHQAQTDDEEKLFGLLTQIADQSHDASHRFELVSRLRTLVESESGHGRLLADELATFFEAADANGIAKDPETLTALLTFESISEFWVEHAKGDKRHNSRGFRIKHLSDRGPHIGGIRSQEEVGFADVAALACGSTWSAARTRIRFGGGHGGFRLASDSRENALDYFDTFTNFGRELFLETGPGIDVASPDIGCGAREIGIMFEGFKSALRDLAMMAYGAKREVGFVGNHVVSPEDARSILKRAFGIDHHDTRSLAELAASERYLELVAAAQITGKPRLGIGNSTGALGRSMVYATLAGLAFLAENGQFAPRESIEKRHREALAQIAGLDERTLLDHRSETVFDVCDWQLLEEAVWPRLLNGTTIVLVGDAIGEADRSEIETLDRWGVNIATSGAAGEPDGTGPVILLSAAPGGVTESMVTSIKPILVVPGVADAVSRRVARLCAARNIPVLSEGVAGAGPAIFGYFEWLRNLSDRARYEAESIRRVPFNPSALINHLMPEFETRLTSILETRESPETERRWEETLRDIVMTATIEDLASASRSGMPVKTVSVSSAQLRVCAARVSGMNPEQRDRYLASIPTELSTSLSQYLEHPDAAAASESEFRIEFHGKSPGNSVQ